MAAGLPLLLRLPPCLRQQLLSREPCAQHLLQRRLHDLLPTRSFHAQRPLAVGNTPPPKPRVLKPESPTTPQSAGHPLPPPKPRSGASPPRHGAPPRPQARPQARPPTRSGSLVDDIVATKYGAHAPSILLYVAASHRSFKTLSLLAGGVFLLGSYLGAELFLKDDPEKGRKAWYVRWIGGVNVLFLAVLSTTLLLGPTKLIKSVSVIQAASLDTSLPSSRLLRIEIKRVMPFAKPDVVTTRSTNVIIDREVRAGSGDLSQISVPAEDAELFTQAYASGTLGKGLGGFGSIANFWPALKRDVRRMLLRENMAYVEIKGSGKFKLDLRDAHVLDQGLPLARFFGTIDPAAKGTIWSRLSTLFKQ